MFAFGQICSFVIVFSIMINYVFSQVQDNIGQSLFADDGALWKRGKNIDHIINKMQLAVNMVEKWSYSWGFKFSVEKTKTLMFTKKRGVGTQIRTKNRASESLQIFGCVV